MSAVLDTKFKVDDFCMVWCSTESDRQQNKEWHRAKILEIKENGEFEVYLRDHGWTIDANEVDILPLPEEIAKVQDLAMQISLFGVRPKLKEFDAETIRDKFASLVQRFNELAISFCIGENRSAILWGVNKQLFALAPTTYTYTNLNIELVQMGVVTGLSTLKHVAHVERSKTLSDDNTNEAKQLSLQLDLAEAAAEPNQYIVNDKITVFNKWKRTGRSEKDSFIAFPTYITSNLDIYALDDGRRNMAIQMEKIICDKLSNRKSLPLTEVRRKPIEEWKMGNPCFAPYDNSYYRAKIKRIYPKEKICSVCYR